MTIASLTAAPATPATASKVAVSPTATPDILPAGPTPAVAEPSDVQSAVAAARQSAAARQDGLAVLMANLMQVAGKLPPALQTALDQLLALHLPTDAAPNDEAVKSAVQSSGLFAEAKLASGASPAQIAADVKTILLRLNQAAEQWLVRAETAPLDARAVDPKQAPPNPQPNAPAPRTQQGASDTRTTTIQGTAVSSGAPLPVRTPLQTAPPPLDPSRVAPNPPNAGAQTSQQTTNPAAPTSSSASRQTSTTSATEPAAANRSSAAVSTSPVEATFSATAALPAALKIALVQLNKAAAIWLAQAAPNAVDTATAQQAVAASLPDKPQPATPSAIAAKTPTTKADAVATPRPQQPTAATSSNMPAPTTAKPQAVGTPSSSIVPAPVAKQTDRAVPLNTAPTANVRSAPQPVAMPTDPVVTAADDAQTALPTTMGPAMQTVRQLTSAMLSTPRADVPPELKTVLFMLNKTTETWSPDTAPKPSAEPAPNVAPKPPTKTDVAAAKTAAPQTLVAPAAATASATSPTTAASPVPNDLKTVLLLLNKVAEGWFADDAPANPPVDPRASTPSVPPPVPGAPGKAQPAAQATLPDNADALLTAGKLVTGSDAALARQTLLQIASLPDAAPQPRGPEARWMFDIPLMTPQGPAVAQLIIERDGSNTTAETPQPVWRVQFAVDIEPLGPVHANLAMSGARTWVTIVADRPQSLEKLRSGASWLADALQATELNADIAFQSGTVPGRTAGRGPYVDHAL